MTPQKNIVIIDDDPRLRSHLKRLTAEVIPAWKILEADNYAQAIELVNNKELDILVCDLFLSSNESEITSKDYIPEGIDIAQIAKTKNPNLFVIIVTSYLDSFLSNYQLLDYMEVGVNAFFDRAVAPYEKFSEPFKYQLQIASDSIIFPHTPVSQLWEIQNIKSFLSYWILICDLNDQDYHDLIGSCLIWEKKLPKPGASVLLIDIHDESKFFHLRENSLLDDIHDYPILLIGESPEMLPNIKIASSSLTMIQKSGNLPKFLNLIHIRLRYKNISEIIKQMELSEYWKWLNINNRKYFSSKKGVIYFHNKNETHNRSKVISKQNNIDKGIRIVRIFLASSSELERDRKEFQIFIANKNKVYIKENIFLELVLWEDFIDAMSTTRLQDEYNKAVEDCDIFVSLFHTKAGEFTEEEFIKALKTFKANGKPLIYTYFKDTPVNMSNINDNILSLINFKKKLKDLEHYPTNYADINVLKYKFGEQLGKVIPKLTRDFSKDGIITT